MSKATNRLNVVQVTSDMDSPKIVGNRLFKVRTVGGFGHRKQRSFADLLRFEEDSYSKWEIGEILLPVYAAVTICEWTGNAVTLDYVYRGRLEGVGPGWFGPLKDAPDRPTFLARPRRA